LDFFENVLDNTFANQHGVTLALAVIRQGSPWHGIEDSRLWRANDGKGRNF